jgi:hypothetical protein
MTDDAARPTLTEVTDRAEAEASAFLSADDVLGPWQCTKIDSAVDLTGDGRSNPQH